jgi:hypothetical protein
MADIQAKPPLSPGQVSAKLLAAFAMSTQLQIEAAESCRRADDVMRPIRGIKGYWRRRRPPIPNGATILTPQQSAGIKLHIPKSAG